MNKLFLTITAATTLCFATQAVSAQEETGRTTKMETTTNSENYTEVQTSELPQAINDAVIKDFTGATISKAYVNEKKEYKLLLQTQATDEAQTVYANEKGEWIEPKKS